MEFNQVQIALFFSCLMDLAMFNSDPQVIIENPNCSLYSTYLPDKTALILCCCPDDEMIMLRMGDLQNGELRHNQTAVDRLSDLLESMPFASYESVTWVDAKEIVMTTFVWSKRPDEEYQKLLNKMSRNPLSVRNLKRLDLLN